MSFKRFITNIFNPQPLIGGLEISDSGLKFILIKGGNLVLASVKLPTGVIVEGKIKDKENFKSVLLNIHSQISQRRKKKIYAILNISDINSYVQVFNLPMAAADNLEEAVELNLQMSSPTDFSTVYADWQKIGEVDIDGGQLEILSAFANKQIINEYVECLKEANFVVAAVEFSSLAVSRLISRLNNIQDPCLFLRLDVSGLNFGLVKNKNLYFNYFVPWPATEERHISLNILKDLIIRETQKVLNFTGKHLPQEQLKEIALITPSLDDKISQIITENFSIPARKAVLDSKFAGLDGKLSIAGNQLTALSPDWFGVLGSALRGLIPRSQDIIISLTDLGTEKEFHQQRIINFIKIWRNIILTSFSFVLAIFIAAEIFLIKNVNSLNSRLTNFINQPGQETFVNSQEEAKNFNAKIDLALRAKNQTFDWTPFLEKIENLTAKEILIDRIFIQSPETPILFNGRATSEKAIIDFKAALEKETEFKEINLPLAGITQTPDGLFKFSVTFKYAQ
ncbi:hypothetical protein COS61_00740 [Candidatus Wolfebacteria bacterium CG03_land_8_20_14_0_80_40_12]|uniref:SHS2 domain-containing protein n=1 Tax=Candidatus Wolfebacteria bacterium CG03_land_8_20_14_0_80_40_12 TaxID=1975069 RepID=A0A2M7B692_9BACT|nr:MAG: hypothetical protein COS61_00740 [Candidatus Wolfebacteria bacterium CG03_land_8_20_14_0_80_40_12]